jgi:hypothetical protein
MASALGDKFTKISDSLVSSFELTKEGQNRVEKGEKREMILMQFLRENLPQTYGIESGEIFDRTGKFSKQVDVIITNTRMPALRSPAMNLFPVESIFASCEVKTNLDAARLEEAVLNAQSVKELTIPIWPGTTTPRQPRPYAVLFAFDGSQPTIRENLTSTYQRLTVPEIHQIDLVCVLNKFIGIGHPSEQGIVIGSDEKGAQDQSLAFLETGRDSLLFFITLLIESIRMREQSQFSFWEYIKPSGYSMF